MRHFHCVGFNGKIGGRKESKWKEPFSIVWNLVREERKRNQGGPILKKTFRPFMRRKLGMVM
jgi:hypothetical protein